MAHDFEWWFSVLVPLGLFVGFIGLLLFVGWLGAKKQEREMEDSIRKGMLRPISQSEYNDYFAVKLKLRVIEGGKKDESI